MKMLIWKEWREHRLIFLLGLVIVIITLLITQLSITSLLTNPHQKGAFSMAGDVNSIILMILSLVFTLFLGATLLANEFSRETHIFLLSQPISRARIYWLKFFFGLVLLAVLVLFTSLILLSQRFNYHFPIPNIHIKSSLFITILLAIYSATFFTSLLVRGTLITVFVTPFVLIIGLLVMFIFLFPTVPWVTTKLFEEPPAVILGLILSLLFMLLGFLCWHKAISRAMYPGKILSLVLASVVFLFFVTYTITNFIANRELRNATISAKNAGLLLTLKEITPPPIPDNENAALVYEEIFSIYEKLKKKYSDEWEYIRCKGDIEELKGLGELIFDDSDFIRMYELLKKASDMPSCRFNIKYDSMRLKNIVYITEMVAVKTRILTDQAKYKEALESAMIGLHIGDAIQDDEPGRFSQLFRMACDSIVMQGLQGMILNIQSEDVPVDVYRRLIAETELRIRKGGAGLKKALEAETNFFIEASNIQQGSFPPGGSFHLKKINLLNIYRLDPWKICFIYFGKPSVKKDVAFYLRYMTRFTSLCFKPYYQIKDDVGELKRYAAIADRQLFLSGMAIPPEGDVSFLKRQAKNTAELDGLRIALALKIYRVERGWYPDYLDTLVPDYIPELPKDPFTGKYYIYRKEDDGFIVYSVGQNEKNDGGIYDEKGRRLYDDLVWQSSQ